MFIIVFLCIFIYLSWIFYNWYFRADIHRYEYAKIWIEVFNRCQTLEEVENLPNIYRPDLIVKRKFLDGSWLVGVTTDMSDKTMRFGAAVLYDSNNDKYILGVSLSGFEVLEGEFQSIKATTLKEFYDQAATKFGLIPFTNNRTNYPRPS